ncbi:MAG: hypothetical protein ACI8VW_000028 [bacterium]|jgi:hypothetical protein
MSPADSDELPPSIYALALVALGLIVYILILLFSSDESVKIAGTVSGSSDQGTESVPTATLLPEKLELTVQSDEQTDGLVYQPDTADTEAAIQDSESATERSARLIRETLGIKERHAPEVAVIVELKIAEDCVKREGEQTSLPILYRFESPTIRTSSINELRSLVSQFRLCENSVFQMTQNTQNGVESNIQLAQMRFDELKYFFTQNNVPKSALQYSKNP